MKPTFLSLGDLLHQRQPFIIPKYQRAYAWDTKGDHREIEDFINDIKRCFKCRKNGKPRTHFFGGIVSIYEATSTIQGRQYEVIDGQQRLATFTMTLKLISSAYQELADEAELENDLSSKSLAETLANNLRSKYLEYPDFEDGHPVNRLRILLSKADRAFFEDLIIKYDHPIKEPENKSRESHLRLFRAYFSLKRDFINEIKQEGENISQKIGLVQLLESTVTEDCQLIHLVAESRSEAYRLFQVLNDRGASLTEGDLLRSSTLEILESSPTLQSRAEELWDNILYDDINKTEQLLRAFFASHKGRRAGKRTLFDEFLKGFFQSPEESADQGRILNQILTLEEEAQIFRYVVESEWPFSNDSGSISLPDWDRYRLRLLISSLKHTLCVPLLIAAQKLGENKFSEVVQLLELFVFRYITVCKRHAGSLEDIYLHHSVAMRKDPDSYNVNQLRESLKELQEKTASDQLFETLLKDSMTYSERGSNVYLRYFLTTLEYYSSWFRNGANGKPRCFDKTAVFDLSQIQIEHIYPRKAVVVDEELKLATHSLGNLSFWGSRDNTNAGNRDFSTKKAMYRQSNISLNREIEKFEAWNLKALNSREEDLVKRAVKIFSA
ncbi:DUF262 domain-containing protein [Nodosilinea sp. FACHB-131]|uniref:DUF262 domain-containing protein n=1 Tax=Cyanophyceae TaxID=3028117 RepID=UPI0016881FEE|nr:DUF262 domain-containing protein [Nodosilinea sp. FACHB-131]MBD1876719.1 DUF262 domain-containing protein [Nodosilinea sp. FACHB-131]